VREIGDRRGEGNALGNLGVASATLGDLRLAVEFYGQNLAVAREIGDRLGEGRALSNSGAAYAALDEPLRAITFLRGALAIFESIESPHAVPVRAAIAKLEKEEDV
jgi:hypothetical protein